MNGYAQIIGPTLGGDRDPGIASLHRWGEADTFTCRHCCNVVHIPAGHVVGLDERCRTCEAPICPSCVKKAVCLPFVERIEQNLIKAQRMREW